MADAAGRRKCQRPCSGCCHSAVPSNTFSDGPLATTDGTDTRYRKAQCSLANRREGKVTAAQLLRSHSTLRVLKVVAVLGVVIVGIALIVTSPFLLRRATGGVSWSRLGEVSATYAAASALLSGLGVGAVAVALLIQARQANAERVDTVRAAHRELVMATLSDMTTYAPCWGPLPPTTAARQQLFTVQILNYYWQGYDVGVITEAALRYELLRDLFAS
jgi:hypothetical protein